MKLFNFINCWAGWASWAQVAWISTSAFKKNSSTAFGAPGVTLKISQKWWMSSEQRI